MAYQAKRRKIYKEDFELLDENGNVVHSLRVSLDADSMVTKLSEKHLALVNALQNVQNAKNTAGEDALTVLGNTVIDILEAVFGKDDAKTIIDFYDNRYIEMCQEEMPFVTGTVIPEVRKISQENKKQNSSFFSLLCALRYVGSYDFSGNY